MEQQALSETIADYIENRLKEKLEKFDKEAEKKRAAFDEDELHQKRQAIIDSFQPVNWLTDAAKRAKQINLVTHALKFTHTDAKGSSIYAGKAHNVSNDDKQQYYLTTASLHNPDIDAVGNAAALDVAKMLQLQVNGECLVDYLQKDDISPLKPFSQSEQQLTEWFDGFEQVFLDKQPSSHTLAKQVYFPIDLESRAYHLLSPLYPTSLAHSIQQKIVNDRRYYLDLAKKKSAPPKAKKDKKYHKEDAVFYFNTAVQSFGGTKPQNVSQLNTNRKGEFYLLSCEPPQWQKILTPPMKEESIFSAEYDRRAWKTAKELKEYLERILAKNSNKPRRDLRAEYVDKLIEILFNYAAQIIALERPGWSTESNIYSAQKLWLDPERMDDDFQNVRKKGEWQDEIADQFATWLNRKLDSKKITTGDSEHREWEKILKKKLKLLRDDLEAWG